jgi:acetyltransferase-like isoleucine patch superfamily enzyme
VSINGKGSRAEMLSKFKNNRKSLLSFVGGTTIDEGAYVSPFSRVQRSVIGSRSSIGWFCVVDDTTVGKSVSIASHCAIGGPQHLMAQPCQRLSERYIAALNGNPVQRCEIGHDVWIGAHSVIAAGVSIGIGAVIGANSFVNQDIPPYAVAAGTPARVIRQRFSADQVNALLAAEPWTWDNAHLMRFAELHGDTWTGPDIAAYSAQLQSGL